MAHRSQPIVWRTIVLAGLTAGALDLVFALIFYGLKGISPERLLQGIATGLFGRSSFQLGFASMAVGVFVHFFASICAALVYYLTSLRFALLTRRPLVSGAVFGIGMYLTMNFVVIPLSRIGFRMPSLGSAIGELCSHIFLFGFSAALIIASARQTAAAMGAQTVQPADHS